MPQFYVVGGAVRDVLLNRKVDDVDFVVVGATADWMLANGFTQVGADFPLFLKNGEEYALARTERKSGTGYHGFTVDFGEDVTIEDDLVRRDLTINSLAVPLESWRDFCEYAARDERGAARAFVVGPYADLFNKTIRANSGSFKEDPVRVLRTLRFMTLLGESWTVDPETDVVMREMVLTDDFQKHLTRERVLQEVTKVAERVEDHSEFVRFLDTMADYGAMSVVFPDYEPGKLAHVRVPGPILGCEMAAYMVFAARDWSVERTLDHLRQRRWTNDALDFAKTMHALDRSLEFGLDADRLAKVFKYSNSNRVIDASGLLLDWAKISVSTYFHILTSLKLWDDVKFNSLTPEQQSTLQGREISMAIFELRKQKLCNYLAGQ
jgi:tRNA nucleotidyltransferase/poly(A) polymerase